MKLLHSADWQIGRHYSQFHSGDGEQLQLARIEAVRRIASIATEHQVDAVVVAGDVFDVQSPREKTIHRLFEATKEFAGPWVLLPGNHDAALAESVWGLAERLKAIPPNVHICLAPQPRLLDGAQGARLTVFPAPLEQRHTHEDLTAWFDAAPSEPGTFRIGVAHGSVSGVLPDDADAPNPIAADRAERARLDYLALGDWHGKLQVNERTWYSGTPEADRFRGNDPGYALLVEIAAPGALPTVAPVAIGRYRWSQFDFSVQDESDAARAVEGLAAIDAHSVVEVKLSGSCDLGSQERILEALRAAENRAAAFVLSLNDLRLAPTEADLQRLQADGFVGDAVAELKQQLAGPEADVARDALLELARVQRQLQPQTAGGLQ